MSTMVAMLPCPLGACSSLAAVRCVPKDIEQGRQFKNQVKERKFHYSSLLTFYQELNYKAHSPEGLPSKWV